eukprot:scaffold10072_cov112-Skeletonema_marinoi.AAC.4
MVATEQEQEQFSSPPRGQGQGQRKRKLTISFHRYLKQRDPEMHAKAGQDPVVSSLHCYCHPRINI